MESIFPLISNCINVLLFQGYIYLKVINNHAFVPRFSAKYKEFRAERIFGPAEIDMWRPYVADALSIDTEMTQYDVIM